MGQAQQKKTINDKKGASPSGPGPWSSGRQIGAQRLGRRRAIHELGGHWAVPLVLGRMAPPPSWLVRVVDVFVLVQNEAGNGRARRSPARDYGDGRRWIRAVGMSGGGADVDGRGGGVASRARAS